MAMNPITIGVKTRMGVFIPEEDEIKRDLILAQTIECENEHQKEMIDVLRNIAEKVGEIEKPEDFDPNWLDDFEDFREYMKVDDIIIFENILYSMKLHFNCNKDSIDKLMNSLNMLLSKVYLTIRYIQDKKIFKDIYFIVSDLMTAYDDIDKNDIKIHLFGIIHPDINLDIINNFVKKYHIGSEYYERYEPSLNGLLEGYSADEIANKCYYGEYCPSSEKVHYINSSGNIESIRLDKLIDQIRNENDFQIWYIDNYYDDDIPFDDIIKYSEHLKSL